MIVDGDADADWVAPDEDFEKIESDEDTKEEPQEEAKEEGKRGRGCRGEGRGHPGKKQWKKFKGMKTKALNSMIGVFRTVIREELGYALKGETPPAVEDMEIDLEGKGFFRMMAMGKMDRMGPGMMGPGMCKPKF